MYVYLIICAFRFRMVDGNATTDEINMLWEISKQIEGLNYYIYFFLIILY